MSWYSDLLDRFLAITTAGDKLDVAIQDQTTPPFHYYLMTENKTDIGLTAGIPKDTTVIPVTSGHGFTVTAPNDYIAIWEDSVFEQIKVIGVSGDNITVSMPIANPFTIAAQVVRGKIDLNVDGSTVHVDAFFRMFGPNAIVPIDIIGGKVVMLHSSAGDRSKYGDLAALADGDGTFLRQNNGSSVNLGDYQNNQDYEEHGWSVEFDDKAGGGNFSTVAEIDVKKTYGVAIRFDPNLNDYFQACIRGNLSALNRHRFILFGQYTEGE